MFENTLKHEKGYQCDSLDTGNYNLCGELVGTNMGITSIAVSEFFGIECPGSKYMYKLNTDDARRFYELYFVRYKVDKLQSKKIAELYFDLLVLSPKLATTALQRAIKKQNKSIEVDGRIGRLTIQSANQLILCCQDSLYADLIFEWEEIIKASKKIYRKGWLNRLTAFK